MKFQFYAIIAVIQFILVITGTVLIGIVCAYLINPSTIYLGGLSDSKMLFVQTYLDKNYDFITHKNLFVILSNEFDRLALYIAGKAFNHFIMNGIIVGLSLVNSLLGIMGYFRKQHKLIVITALLSFVIALYVFYQLLYLTTSVREITFSTLNDTLQLRKDIYQCSICYKSVEVMTNNKNHILDIIALSLNVFQCCGIKSYKDSMYGNEIPFTCCPRQSYNKVSVHTSTQCLTDKVYQPCHNKLSKFMIYKTVYLYKRAFMSILFIFNVFYSLLTLISKYSESRGKKIPPKRGNMNEIIKFNPISQSKMANSEQLKEKLSLSNDKNYLIDSKFTSETKNLKNSNPESKVPIQNLLTDPSHKERKNNCQTIKKLNVLSLTDGMHKSLSHSESIVPKKPTMELMRLTSSSNEQEESSTFSQIQLNYASILNIKTSTEETNCDRGDIISLKCDQREKMKNTTLPLQIKTSQLSVKDVLLESNIKPPSMEPNRKNSTLDSNIQSISIYSNIKSTENCLLNVSTDEISSESKRLISSNTQPVGLTETTLTDTFHHEEISDAHNKKNYIVHCLAERLINISNLKQKDQITRLSLNIKKSKLNKNKKNSMLDLKIKYSALFPKTKKTKLSQNKMKRKELAQNKKKSTLDINKKSSISIAEVNKSSLNSKRKKIIMK